MKKLIIIQFFILTIIILSFNPLTSKVLTVYYANKYNLQPRLFYKQIKTESYFRCFVVSNKQAIGLGQVKFLTARYVDSSISKWQLFLPWKNLDISARYMLYLKSRYKNNNSVVLAAYNWGETNVDRLLKERNITIDSNTDYRYLFQSINETYQFITKILD